MLIDGHSMAFRAFYALPAGNFSTSGGQHTNAVYGFVSMLVNLLGKEKPSHVAVAFDVGRKTFRTDMFADYKAQRDPTPEEFKGQVELLKKLLPAMGISWLEKDDFEADDIIATLATRAQDEGFDTLVVTGDRDSFQLVTDHVTVLYPRKGVSTMDRFTPAAIEDKYGLTPKQYPDFAALRGDPSDNLPKIPGVGEKTATKWIVDYGDLDTLLAHADDIGGKVGGALRERIDQVKMNRALTEMVRDMELDKGPSDFRLGGSDADEITSQFDALEFGGTLRSRVFDALGIDSGERPTADTAESIVFDSPERLAGWLTTARAQAGIAVTVTGRADPASPSVARVALAAHDHHAVAFDPAQLDADDEKTFADFIADSSRPKIFHDAKSAWHMLTGSGYSIDGIAHDTMIAAYLLNPEARSYSIGDVYQRIMQVAIPAPPDGPEDGGSGDGNDGQLSLLDIGDSDTGPDPRAAMIDAACTRELACVLTDKLEQINQLALYTDLELALVPILGRMERTGIAVDMAVLTDQRDAYIDKIEAELSAARDIAGDPELNLSSPKQLQVVLFEKLGLPKTKKIKTGYSTAAKELEALAAKSDHPFLQHLMSHREYQKMKTTLDGLIKAVADDGRIHTTFNQTATATGRLSSTEPNLQNIPVRTEAGRIIRSAFCAGGRSGGVTYTGLVTADYSQIEMRVMAHVSGDEGLIEAYRQGEDLHNYVGSKVFDVPVDNVTPDLRRKVKAMSYGLAYGLSAFGLAGQLSISAKEAKEIMDTYFQRFGGVKAYLDQVVVKAAKDGYTQTVFGRRRYLPDLTSTNRIARENAERAALNSPIQGTAADVIKIAMIRVDGALRTAQLKSRVLLQVHDELVVEVADGELDSVRELVEQEMDQAVQLTVPLEVSTGHGANWDEAAH
ncbi:DNA polymerase I [Corynebacterium mendelii]|uniref:DNA polymerase I n=1 Tax=Corynebacterium mendelii TaxID=2765362 RepID=A0A939E0B3_9CORY|nr:DNA polymerase I [Corynebacterium mendelii]MBN9644590.1 DNA polymerase I [Corynebacterium mendelii]